MNDLELDDWVAVRKDVFVPNDLGRQAKFLIAWNEELGKASITMLERSRQASDNWSHSEAGIFSILELFHFHQQLSLLHPDIKFPQFFQTNKSKLFFNKKTMVDPNEATTNLQYYLTHTLSLCGINVIRGILFQKGDVFSNYEESVTELRQKSFESDVDEAIKELEEILLLRNRCETMLEMASVYNIEEEVVTKLVTAMGNLYNFQLWQFIDEREFAQSKVDNITEQLKTREIGERIKKNLQDNLKKWKEQYSSADEAVQQLYEEYYRRTWKIFLEQRNRMKEDQFNFGKVAYSLHAWQMFHNVDVKCSQEKLKLLHVVKATRELQRDRICDIRMVSSKKESYYDEEIYVTNLNCLELGLEVLDEQENLLKKKITFVKNKIQTQEEEGIFFDAQETFEDCEGLDDPVHINPELVKLTKNLNSVFRKRAAIRNKKKALTESRKKTVKSKEEKLVKQMKHHSIQIKREERVKEEKSLKEQREMEKQRTLQRLKNYRKKYVKEETHQLTEEEMSKLPPPPSEWFTSDETTKGPKNTPKPVCENTCESRDRQSRLTVSDEPEKLELPPDPKPPPPPPPSLIPPPPPPPPPSSLIPPPPPPPSSLIPPPPPPPPPFTSLQPLKPKVSITPKHLREENVQASGPPSICLTDIIAARSKLKKRDDEDEGYGNHGKLPLPQDGNLQSILRSVVSRIRVHISDSDSDCSQDNEDFD